MTTAKYVIATAATTADTSGSLSESAGVVNAATGFSVGTIGTNDLAWDYSGVTGHKTYTALNQSGTVRPSTGSFTAGHMVSTDANGLLVDGGAAGTGTWTDSSTSTGTNKTLIAALAGGGAGNVIQTQLVASFDGGSLTADGTNCQDPVKVTINSGPSQYAILCATPASAQFGAVLVGLKQAVATFKVRLKVNDTVSSAHHYAGTFKAQCRASGAAPSSTWGSTQTVDITLTTANNTYEGLTSAITANGTCALGSDLYVQFDANGSMTDTGTARVLGLSIEQAS